MEQDGVEVLTSHFLVVEQARSHLFRPLFRLFVVDKAFGFRANDFVRDAVELVPAAPEALVFNSPRQTFLLCEILGHDVFKVSGTDVIGSVVPVGVFPGCLSDEVAVGVLLLFGGSDDRESDKSEKVHNHWFFK